MRLSYGSWRAVSIVASLLTVGLLSGSCSSDSSGSSGTARTDPVQTIEDGSQSSGGFRLTFESPTGPQVEVNAGSDGLGIKIALFQAPPTATWGLYYSPTLKDIAAATPILEDLPVSITEVKWNTAAMKEGEYYLFAETRAGNVRSIYWLGSKVIIKVDPLDGTPKVVISTATSGQVYLPTNTLKVDYSAIVAGGTVSAFNVFLTKDGGATWRQLEDKTTNRSTTITFADTDAQSSRYKIKVEAESGASVGVAESEGFFGFAKAPVSYTGVVAPVIAAKCATSGCHGTTGTKGFFLATSWDNVVSGAGSFEGINTKKERIYQRTRVDGDMPPAGSVQLTPAERDLIELWSWRQYPRN
jgi:hypothetical protein